MANFEALIRGALSSQDAGDAQIRAKIYQSSRNALHRMITENRSFTVEAAIAQQQNLEAAITKIETEFNLAPTEHALPQASEPTEPATPEPQPVPQPVQQQQPIPQPQPAATPPQHAEPIQPQPAAQATPVEPAKQSPADDLLTELQEIIGDGIQPSQNSDVGAGHQEPHISVDTAYAEPQEAPQLMHVDPVAEPDIDMYHGDQYQDEYYPEERKLPQGFAERRKSQKRFIGLAIFILILLLLGFLGYRIYHSVLDSGLLGSRDAQNQNILSRQNNREDFITILEASDPSSLIVANRGSAEIITQQNSQMIRLFSTRLAENRQQSAAPILLRLPPGVVEQISNKSITVEIFAKSGTSNPAQFRVECKFEGVGECTPKRFRIGLQPEASVFAANIGNVTNADQGMYLAINTDTTSSASITGKGDVIDIAYVRIKAN